MTNLIRSSSHFQMLQTAQARSCCSALHRSALAATALALAAAPSLALAPVAEGSPTRSCEHSLLFPKNPLCPIPCFRPRIHPVHSRGVVVKGIGGLKCAVRPFGLNQPLITVTQYDVKKRSSRARPHFNNVAGICDGQRARLWNLVEKRSPHSLIEPRATGRTGPIPRELRSLSAIGLEADHG